MGFEWLFILVTCFYATLVSVNFGHIDARWQSAFSGSRCGEVGMRRECPHCSVVYLAEHRRATKLRLSLWLLFRNFNDKYCYPIKIFHTDDLDPVVFRKYLSRDLSDAEISLITFHPVTFEFPKSFDEKAARRDGIVFEHRYPYYHHMIAFWFKNVFDHAASNRAEYWLRLDTDAYIYSPIRYDIFGFMKNRDLRYGYRWWTREQEYYVQGLWDFITNYIDQRKLTPQQAINKRPENGSVPSVYNNFEIFHVPTFRNAKEFVDYREAVFETNKIYSKRWGDAPLRALQVCLLLPSEKVHHFCDIDYHHQEWFYRTCEHEDRNAQKLDYTCDGRVQPRAPDALLEFGNSISTFLSEVFGL